jgi:hypothetical protein
MLSRCRKAKKNQEEGRELVGTGVRGRNTRERGSVHSKAGGDEYTVVWVRVVLFVLVVLQ